MLLRTLWMCFPRERIFFVALWTDEFCDKAAKTSKKNSMLEQKWLCNKQILIRCLEKLNLSVQKFGKKFWKDKMQGLQNIKCILVGYTSWFHLFIMVTELCCETCFWHSWNTRYVSVKVEHFFFYIIINTILLKKCFEYAHTIIRDWICCKSVLDSQSPKQIYN